MSGTRGGTGKPLFLKCSQCKKFRDSHGSAIPGKLMRTGRKRPYTVRGAKGRTPTIAWECRCLVCGHAGWYAHADATKLPLEHLYNPENSPPRPIDFEPGFLEALNGLKRLRRKAERHNDFDGGFRMWSGQVLILVDCAMSLLDRFEAPKAKAQLLENFRFEKRPK